MRDLNRDVTRYAAGHLIDELLEIYRGIDDVIAYLDAVRKDVVENNETFAPSDVIMASPAPAAGEAMQTPSTQPPPEAGVDRYGVNVLVDSGQVNGLAVSQLGHFAFGKASHITARVRLGKSEVIDIEREVDLGGPLHSKGVLILAGYLGSHFAADQPLSLSASLMFEQSHGGVDGDSASSTELYAILSALAEAPIKQNLAVTGSVNQYGEIQAIGGVNEKIEGFFDLCRARGLTGDQGVMIPAANVKNLMLRSDIVEAARQGRFHVYPIAHIEQGIERLTGIAAGTRDENGNFPENTINHSV